MRPDPRSFLLTAAFGLALIALLPSSSDAVVRTCGPDPVANTELVLCAPPSGPCDATSVVVGKTITMKNASCTFDLGGRDLRVERALRMVGTKKALFVGDLAIIDAGDVTIARRGTIAVRGTFARPPTGIQTRIAIQASGSIHHGGTLDISGLAPGRIELESYGDIVFTPRSRTLANSRTPLNDHVHGDWGGDIEAFSLEGNLTVSGRLFARSGDSAGDIFLWASRDVLVLNADLEASAGIGLGGYLDVYAGDHLTVMGSSFDASSRFGGGDGGSVDFIAGMEFGIRSTSLPGGIVPSGNLRIEDTLIDVRGSSADEFGGSGGDVSIDGRGSSTVYVADDVVIRADGSTSFDSSGGSIEVYAGDYPPVAGLDADLYFGGTASVRGGRNLGDGGYVFLSAGGNLVSAADIDTTAYGAGEVTGVAGGDVTVSGPISASAAALPEGGSDGIQLVAGLAREGRVVVANDLRAAGAPFNFPPRPFVSLAGCGVEVRPGVAIDGGVVSPSGPASDLGVQVISGHDIVIGQDARIRTAPHANITFRHLPGLDPVIGPGVRFDPALTDEADPLLRMPHCPHCGPNRDQPCEPTVVIETLEAADEDALEASVLVSSATGAPLTGSVEVCDGTGVEELSFTWLATSCGADDLFQLTVNDVAVATVSPDSDGLGCRSDASISTHPVPIADVLPLLAPGINRFGIRKSAGTPSQFTSVVWAYATVRVGGVERRLDVYESFVGASGLPFIPGSQHDAIDASAPTDLCDAAVSVPWSGQLPCAVDLGSLEPDTSYTLLVRATDAPGSSALDTIDFTRASETTLRLNMGDCE